MRTASEAALSLNPRIGTAPSCSGPVACGGHSARAYFFFSAAPAFLAAAAALVTPLV
ncbi:MAG: hypothetical protein ACI89L_002720 [Phycisphaerales bacterium]|jgi:hypothetical protein